MMKKHLSEDQCKENVYDVDAVKIDVSGHS